MLTYADVFTSGQASKAAELGMSLEQVLKKTNQSLGTKISDIGYFNIYRRSWACRFFLFFPEQYKEQLAAKALYTSSLRPHTRVA